MSGIEYNKKVVSSGNTKVSFNNQFIFDNLIQDYQKTNNNISESSLAKEDGTMDLNLFLEDNNTEDYETSEITDSLGYDTTPKEEKGFLEKVGDWFKSAGATVAVATTSVLSGVADIGEAVLDGGAWVAAKAVGLFSEEGANAIEEFIARDLVSEANKAFYENTELGKAINDASALKYDSELAQGIRSVSEDVGVFAISTALTVCTGGAATVLLPVATGFAYGAGNKAEEVYQQYGTDTTLSQELGIAVSGIGEAANWYAMGKMGEGGLKVVHKIGELGWKNTGSLMTNGFKSLIKKLGQRSLSQNLQAAGTGLKNLLKGTFNKTNLSRAFSSSLRDIDNLTDSIGIVGDNVAAWLNGDEEFNLKSLLGTTLELSGAFLTNMTFSAFGEYLTKLKRIDDIPSMNKSQQKKVDAIFDLEHQVAKDNNKYLDSFKTYREHAELHTKAVTDYAVMLGLNLENIDDRALAEIYYGAYFHDLGMAGGGVDADGRTYGLNYNKKTGEYKGKLDDVVGSKAAGDAARDNHPLNSALSILTGDLVPDGIDRDKVALLALSHSKSTSGVSSFTDVGQWENAISKLDDAVKKYNEMNKLTGSAALVFDADKMRQLISDPNSAEFKQLVDQALCIRDGDAMSNLAFTPDGRTIMQTGTIANVDSPRIDANSKIPTKEAELAAVTDRVTANDGTYQFDVNDEYGKLFHAGEENVNFDSTYSGKEYVGRVQLIDAQKVPNSTIYVINERLGELATYTNCDRSFIIELPEELIDTPYGKSYIEAIEQTVIGDIAKATDNFGEGKISQEQLDSIKDFYKNGITIPGYGKLKIEK